MKRFDIREFGAGAEIDTGAIQAAIDACNSAGGGVVYCPPGEFKTGTLWLKSHVTLHLESGCRLRGSDDRADYVKNPIPESVAFADEKVANAHLLIAYRAANVAITGGGIIDGNGPAFLPHLRTGENVPWGWRPAQMVYVCQCREVRIADVRLDHAPYWTLFLHGCERVRIHGVSITNHDDTPNGDGIDVDCCRDVCINSCQIHSGDDSITLRANEAPLGEGSFPCENVTVTNCVLHSRCNAIRVGVGRGTIRHCVFNNIVVRDSGIGINVISNYSTIPDSTEIRHLQFTNMIVHADMPLYLSTGAQGASPVRDIVFSNLDLQGRTASYIGGTPTQRLSAIALRNVRLTVCEGARNQPFRPDFQGNPEWTFRGLRVPCGLCLSDAEEIELDNLRLRWDNPTGAWRYGLFARNIERLLLSGVVLASPIQAQPDA